MRASLPFVSVIVPAHQGGQVLRRSLAALRASDLPREQWELIVVDDASTDDTASVAGAFADSVIRLPGAPHGPAYARNRAVEVCRGDVLVFIDADVCVRPDALRRLREHFVARPELGAVFGSYCHSPSAPGTISQYRNLLHHYVHHRNAGAAETFWAGCGAVRRRVFAEVGRFDEQRYPRPQIEDIELGRRIRRRGYGILLDPAIQGTHLKGWTLRDLVVGDLRNRGVPWMRLLLREGSSSGSRVLNLRVTEKWCTALVGVALGALCAALVLLTPWPLLVSLVAVWLVGLFNLSFYRFLRAQRGLWFALQALPLHLVYYVVSGVSAILGWALYHLKDAPEPLLGAGVAKGVELQSWVPAPAQPGAAPWTAAGPGSGQGSREELNLVLPAARSDDTSD